MEAVILSEQELQLSPSWSWHDFNPGGTKVSAQTRKTLIPNVCLREGNLDGLRADGDRPITGLSAMATIELLLGFRWSDTPKKPHTGLIELNHLDHFFKRVFESETGWTEMAEAELVIHKLVNGQNSVLTPFQQTLLFVGSNLSQTHQFQVNLNMSKELLDFLELRTCWTMEASFKLKLYHILRPGPISWPWVLLDCNDVADTVLIASNNARISCFRATLCANSTVFRAMFRHDTRERRTGEVDLKDLSEESVIALTRYLAISDLEAIKKDSQICFELFQAAHIYEIKSLEENTAYFLCSNEVHWYSDKVALHLFYLAELTLFPMTNSLKRKSQIIYNMKKLDINKLSEHQKFLDWKKDETENEQEKTRSKKRVLEDTSDAALPSPNRRRLDLQSANKNI